ncbi:MAG: hypothetical protein AAF533_05130 [Acidobacteriota bacterium]
MSSQSTPTAIKTELTTLANRIRTTHQRARCLRKRKKPTGDLQVTLSTLSRDFRYLHVAASLRRGTPLHRIERPAPSNRLDPARLRRTLESITSPERLHVIVRTDLSRIQQAVQAGHGVAEWLLQSTLVQPSRRGWWNGTLVYLGVEDEDALRRLHGVCGGVLFHEPDRNHEATALALLGEHQQLRPLPALDLT